MNGAHRLAALALAGALTIVSACGSDGESGRPAGDSAAGVTADSAVGRPDATLGSSPAHVSDNADSTPAETADTDTTRRIIPLDGSVAEIVFALGLGDEVVAADLSATYPQAAADLPKIGFERALNAEPILEFEPTIVVGTDGAGPPETIDELERVGVPVAIVERQFSPSGPAAKIRGVADALGVAEAGDALARQVQQEIDDATVVPSVYARPLRVLALYLRGAELQFVLGSGSGVHWIIEAAGAIDIADQLGAAESTPISAEGILAAAPDVIVVPQDGLASAGGTEALLALPGIAETPAGQAGAILAYDDQLMLGNGPRTGAFLAQLVTDLRAVDAARP